MLSSSEPLVWIDCEMTGLNETTDVLLQICCYITDSQLNLLEPNGFEAVIHRPYEVLSRMDEWCTGTHSLTGLIERVYASNTSPAAAGEALLRYIKTYVPCKRTALLAGSSVHADRVFLMKEMPEVVQYLHYRLLDVSSIKEAAKRWCIANGDTLGMVPKKTGTHEARMDILETIEEARYWKETLFASR